MNDNKTNLKQYDDWLKDESEVAALVMRQWLTSVEGKGSVIFPPTYPIDQNKAGYNIDRFNDGTSVCQIDSVGSQANRMEPIFKRPRYNHLVPKVVIRTGDREVHLLDAGHRAADAIVRFSTLGPELHEAFSVYRDKGNAAPLAKIAPTSIVFGSWDSRSTQAKLPRLIRSVIRAYDVKELTRSAQYTTIAGEILEGGEAEVAAKGTKSELGLAHVPAVQKHGGILVQGEIRRDAILNLASLRSLAGPSDRETMELRRYVLGLALVAFTAPMEPCLREGCELVPDPDRETAWTRVKHDGTRTKFRVAHDEAITFADASAASFSVSSPRTGVFESDVARTVLNLDEKDRKNLLRQGPVTKEALEQLGKKSSKPASKRTSERKKSA
jgi:CRISPR-associated protein Csb1